MGQAAAGSLIARQENDGSVPRGRLIMNVKIGQLPKRSVCRWEAEMVVVGDEDAERMGA